jgi:hypothetical protein
MTQNHELFRLRIGTEVVGYMKIHANGLNDVSTDQFWWATTPIEYNAKDQYCGLKDKNNFIKQSDVIGRLI